ncbi:Ig-like domain-containing protein [Deminuibacter soli]|uniref:Uncharacterized protein n=1 Tax=Deminuibacter soli TaxID=2291815 RepID=A0A3E1NLQ7_9BACT|nr:Ig-like domain-containing protein [Deminuibacter soli]RFM28784.1 hypothetical protein DXN05_08380 [Deminuibacter soli]
MLKFYLTTGLLLVMLATVGAQTNPVPQPIPYSQDFSALATNATTYPDGWQGWVLATTTSSAFKVTPPTGDKALTASGTAASTAGAVYNYNGKLGVLNSGSSGDQGLVLAVNTSGKQSLQIHFDVMTVRNPYGGSNSRINEVVLQYRVGTTGNFSNINGTLYQNNTVNQQSGTEPQNLLNIAVPLPDSCSNQPVVQLRWTSREVSGAGSRPSFAIDNITISSGNGGSDTTAPAVNTLFPAAGATGVIPSAKPFVQFSETVSAGAGAITVFDKTAHTAQTFAITDSLVSLTGNTLTINAKLKPLHSYYVLLDSGIVQDAAGNSFAGIRDSAAWTFTIGRQQLVFNFNNCSPSGSTTLDGGFTQYSVTGAQTWACTTFGQTGNAVQINGFAGSSAVDNEDWLISPAFDFTGFHYPLLSFASRSKFAGPSLRLMVSTDYDGIGNPNNFTWTPVNGRFPNVDSDVWTLSDAINLNAFKAAQVYIAFVYTSSVAASASRWTIDEVSVTDSDSLPPAAFKASPAAIDFDYVASGSKSAAQPFNVLAYNLHGAVTLTASAGFTIAADTTHFSNTLTIAQDSAESRTLTLYARFEPNAANQDFKGTIQLQTAGITAATVSTLTGSSLRALKVVNWNIEWFGNPQQGPTNDSLQQQNVQTVLKNLNADIFALAEVCDTTRIRQVVANMPGYAYTLSDFGSYADNVNDTDYNAAQKLAFVYKTAVVSNLQTYGVLRSGGSSNAYYNWSSGRFPYLMKANVHFNNDTAQVNFIVLHGKANTGTAAEKIEAWNRRKGAADELKDTLDQYFKYQNIIILGDFNDALNKTITTEKLPDTTSSYSSFTNDSADYKFPTLPLSLAGDSSTVGNANVIDNVVLSNEMGIAYVPASAHVLYQAASLVSSYGTTTTDHYPVVTRYDIGYVAHTVPIVNFTASADTAVKLSWYTSHEINSKYFIIERSHSSTSGFAPVDTLTGHADTRDRNDYSTTDFKPFTGTSYYRVKQVSLDSTVTYSNVQAVNVTPAARCLKVSVLNKQVTIEICSSFNGRGYIQLIDMYGHVWLQLPIIWFKGTNINRFFTYGMASGIYFIRIVQPDKAETAQIFLGK